MQFPTVAVTCTAESHPQPTTLAVYQGVQVQEDDGRLYWRWSWHRELAVGGGRIDADTGARSWRHTKTVPLEDQQDFGTRQDCGPKRLVRDDRYGRYDLECPKCGLRRRVQFDKLEALLTTAHSLGVSRLRLQDVVARLR